MRLNISKDKTIHDLQAEFSARFPYLKLEFYKPQQRDESRFPKKHLLHSVLLKAAGLKTDTGSLEIRNDMTVADLEKAFRKEFGLNAQVSRKSGMLWLETTMTDKWSLEKQNEHGREISLSSKEMRLIEGEDEEG
jgi:hypothetical protein